MKGKEKDKTVIKDLVCFHGMYVQTSKGRKFEK